MSCGAVEEVGNSPILRCQVARTGPDVVLVTVAGEADLSGAGILRSAFNQALMSGVRTITVDASRLEFFDCSALRCLITTAERAKSRGVDFGIINPSRAVLRVVVLCGLAEQLLLDSTSRVEA